MVRFPHVPCADRFDQDSWADYGILTAKLDSQSAFSKQMEIRTAARKAFVKVDTGKRVARALLRKSAPIPGNYSVGDLIIFMIKRKETQK